MDITYLRIAFEKLLLWLGLYERAPRRTISDRVECGAVNRVDLVTRRPCIRTIRTCVVHAMSVLRVYVLCGCMCVRVCSVWLDAMRTHANAYASRIHIHQFSKMTRIISRVILTFTNNLSHFRCACRLFILIKISTSAVMIDHYRRIFAIENALNHYQHNNGFIVLIYAIDFV